MAICTNKQANKQTNKQTKQKQTSKQNKLKKGERRWDSVGDGWQSAHGVRQTNKQTNKQTKQTKKQTNQTKKGGRQMGASGGWMAISAHGVPLVVYLLPNNNNKVFSTLIIWMILMLVCLSDLHLVCLFVCLFVFTFAFAAGMPDTYFVIVCFFWFVLLHLFLFVCCAF